MPIRVVDSVGRVGRVQSPVSTLTSVLAGTHVAPAARSGIITAAIGTLGASMLGVFSPSASRSGVIAAAVGTLGGALRGTFVPAGNTVNVANVTQLMNAIDAANNAGGNRIISIADGFYALPDTIFINVPNVTLRGASGNRANVILRNARESGLSANPLTWADSLVQFNVRVAAAFFAAYGITFAGWCNASCIQFVGEQGANDALLSNCIVQDSYQHLVKGSTDNVTPGPARGIVEDSLLRFTAGAAPAQYNGGIDVHKGASWIVRRNRFQDIASPISNPCQHAAGFWNGCTNTLMERNAVVDCDRGLGSGLKADVVAGGNTVAAVANSGDIIRNNMVSHVANSDPGADVGISVENSTNAKVYNNSVFLASSIINWALEYRWNTPGAEFTNNLSNRQILARDGAVASLSKNVTNAQASWFVDVTTADLRLTSSAPATVVDAGVNLAAVTDDYVGTARPQGVLPDVGAFEIIVTSDPRQLPRLQAAHVTYAGFIQAPDITQLEYGGSCLTVHSDGASMFMGQQNEQDTPYVCRFTIPAFGQTGTIITQPKLIPGSVGPGLSELGGALHRPDGKIVIGKFNRYDANGGTTANLAIGSEALTGFTAMQAMANLPTKNFAGQYIGNIPDIWQPLLGGKPCFAGSSTTSIISQCPNGPGMFGFDPADIGVRSPIPSVPMLYYTYPDHPLVSGQAPPANDIWAWADFPAAGMAIIDGTRTAIFITRHGYGPREYKGHNDPCDPDAGGEQAYPYRYQATLWDLNDIADVVAGIKQPWEPRPYAWFPIPGITDQCCLFVFGGISWDKSRRILWIVPRYGGGSKRIHGLKIATLP